MTCHDTWSYVFQTLKIMVQFYYAVTVIMQEVCERRSALCDILLLSDADQF